MNYTETGSDLGAVDIRQDTHKTTKTGKTNKQDP